MTTPSLSSASSWQSSTQQWAEQHSTDPLLHALFKSSTPHLPTDVQQQHTTTTSPMMSSYIYLQHTTDNHQLLLHCQAHQQPTAMDIQLVRSRCVHYVLLWSNNSQMALPPKEDQVMLPQQMQQQQQYQAITTSDTCLSPAHPIDQIISSTSEIVHSRIAYILVIVVTVSQQQYLQCPNSGYSGRQHPQHKRAPPTY